jgi:hypothetical protein
MGGGPQYQNTQESTADQMQAYAQYFPELIRSIAGQTGVLERSQQALSQELAPQQAQLQLDMANQFMPGFTQVGLDQSRQQAMGTARNDADVLAGPGRDVITSLTEAQRLADPEYFRQREMSLGALENLFGSLDDPNGGMGAMERAEIERTLARQNAASGNIAPTALGTVDAAMQFGAAGQQRKQQKQSAIAQAVATAAGAAPSMRSGVDAYQVTTGKPSSNAGVARFGDVNTEQGGATQNFGSQFLQNTGQFASNNQNNLATKESGLDKFSKVMGSMPNCCWTFREFTEKFPGGIPWYVRASRDAYYTPSRREGYRLFSKHMVPLMQKHSWVRCIVDFLLVDPMTRHAAWLAGLNSYGWIFHPLQKLWLATFSFLGSLDGTPAEVYS